MPRPSLYRSLLCLLMLQGAVLPGHAAAQADKPRLMLNTGGPVGGLRSVAFSADGSRLYAAGAGKVVCVWNLTPHPQALQAIPAEPLRWEIARGMRGRIYSLDVAGPQGPLAIGGFSTRGATGDLVLFDPRQQQIAALLPAQRTDIPGPGPAPGHVQTVGAVDFSPDGRRLVSVSIDGEVRLWTLEDNRGSVLLQSAGGVEDGLIRSAAFVGPRRLIVPLRDSQQPAAWRLRLIDPVSPTRPARVLSQPVFWYGVADIALSSDGAEFAASDLIGRVWLFTNGATPTARPLNRPQQQANGRAVRCVASLDYNPQRLLAITTTADIDGMCWLELWETVGDAPRMLQQYEAGRGQAAASVAFSPDGRWLALTRADRGAVELIPVVGGDVPLDVDRSVELTGRGREPGVVQFVGDEGYRIAIDSPADPVRLTFDLQNVEILRLADDEIPAPSRPVDASGWRIEPLPQAGVVQPLQVFAPQSATPRCSIELQTVHQGTYQLHTWLTDAQGQVYGVAIATDRQDGIFLYDLPASGKCRLLRYCRDHHDAIRSLSVCSDGRYLASSAADQTIKIWSLAGLRNVGAQFPREDAWGATFAIEQGDVVVTSAIGPGIAVHRDLLVGDVITQAEFAGPEGRVVTSGAESILRALSERPLWETLVLTTRRDGQVRAPIVVTPAWEPLATLFVDRSREWALWTPQGVYDASAGGDGLFGWHINVGREADPQFFRAEQFRRELERPDLMRQLLLSGSLQDALIARAVAPPRAIGEVAADIPRVRLIRPRPGDSIARGETIAVEAAVRYPNDANLDRGDFRPRLWINQRAGGPPEDVREINGEVVYTWNVPPAAEQNRLMLRIEEDTGAVDSLFNDAWVQVSADLPQPEVTVHVFALAAENYAPGLRLNFCNDDARGVVRMLQQHVGRRYKTGQVQIMTDEAGADAVTRTTVQTGITAFRQRLQQIPEEELADDILVVFVSGHGQAYGKDYFFVPPDPEVTPMLNDRQREEVVRRVGIPWEVLRCLADVRCRKVFLLDTCYSGNVALAEKASLRPLRQAQAMVFSATSENELALAANPVRPMHGLFTGFLLEACDGKADGVAAHSPIHPRFVALQDGNINLKEVVSYVGYNTRQFYQHPKYTPVELLDFVDLSLFRVPGPDETLPQAQAK